MSAVMSGPTTLPGQVLNLGDVPLPDWWKGTTRAPTGSTPGTLHAKHQFAVAGRRMQMIEFSLPEDGVNEDSSLGVFGMLCSNSVFSSSLPQLIENSGGA
jgi:hypothetical protein